MTNRHFSRSVLKAKRKSTGKRVARRGLAGFKGTRGTITHYVTRAQALRKLQISLKDFRRLCILKGIFPREPKKKAHGTDKTYYYAKDINFLAHEPLLAKFHEYKIFLRRFRKALGKREFFDANRIMKEKPKYSLDHLVKERYPTFTEALKDLDDTLCLLHLFAYMTSVSAKANSLIENAARLIREFQAYVVHAHALRKVFLSIKGVYFQAEIMGVAVTWLVPYHFLQKVPKDVDVKIMQIFLEFGVTMQKFVNFKLFHSENLVYPPTLDEAKENSGAYLDAISLVIKGTDESGASKPSSSDTNTGAASEPMEISGSDVKGLSKKLESVARKESKKGRKRKHSDEGSDDDDEDGDNDEDGGDPDNFDIPEIGVGFEDDEELQKLRAASGENTVYRTLFSNCVFFLAREVPRQIIEFVIRAFGGSVGWEGENSPFDHTNPAITHQVVDRESQRHHYLDRVYVQPQWVVDCANERMLIPPAPYAPGKSLPPHLSPFVDDKAMGYTPDQRRRLDNLRARLAAGEVIDDEHVFESDGEGVDEDADNDFEAEEEPNDIADEDAFEEEGAHAGETRLKKDTASPAAKGAAESNKKRKIDASDARALEAKFQEELARERSGVSYSAHLESEGGKKPKKPVVSAPKETEEHRLARMMMGKKDIRLYGKIQKSIKVKEQKVKQLETKRGAARETRSAGTKKNTQK